MQNDVGALRSLVKHNIIMKMQIRNTEMKICVQLSKKKVRCFEPAVFQYFKIQKGHSSQVAMT